MRKKNLWKKAASVIIAAAMMMSAMPVYAATQEQPAEVVVQGTTDEETDDGVETELYVDDEENVGEDSETLQDVTVENVSTAEKLIEVMANTTTTPVKYKNLTIEITADIDLDEEKWTSAFVNGYCGAEVYTINGNGHTLTHLTGALFDRTWAGNGQLIINDLTIADSTICGGSTNGLGAFVGYTEATSRIELNKCHVIGCTIDADKKWTGGLIGYAAGYNKPDDGPVSEYITITNCSVENSTITGAGSTGAFLGHATGNPETYVTIQDCEAEGNQITCTDDDSNKAGSVMGTVGVGVVTVNNVTVSRNTVSSDGVKNKRIAGRFGSAGKLTISGGSYDCQKSEAMPLDKGTLEISNNPKFLPVAAIGDDNYDSLQEAVNDAQGTATIQLLNSTTESIVIPAGKTVNLVIPKGIVLTNTAGSDTITVQLGGTLNISGSGTVDNTSHGRGALFNNGTANLNGCTFDRTLEKGNSKDSSDGNSWYTICNHGVMTIDGATVQTAKRSDELGRYSSLVENGYQNYNSEDSRAGYVAEINNQNPELTIESGTFYGGLNTIKNDDMATITVNGGNFNNYYQHAFLNHHIANINGGIFTANADKDEQVIAVYNCGCDATYDKGIVTITGGTFDAGNKNNKYAIVDQSNQECAVVNVSGGTFKSKLYGSKVKVSGGTFSSDPSDYLADASQYHAHANAAGNKWGVSETDGHNYNYKNNGYNYYCICGDSVYIPPYTPPQPTTPPATTDTVTNPDGSTTSTTTQENTDGSITTTVVDKDSNGNVTGTTETTEKTTGNTTTKTETATTVDGAQTVTETTTVKNQDGSTEETKKVTDKDANGNVTGTTETVEKTEGNTTTTKETTTAADGSQTVTESTLVKNEDGSSEEKATITAADGSVTNVTTTTQIDGSATEVKETSEKNDAGNTVDVTATTKTDSNGDVTSVKEQSVITNVADNTSATVNVLKDGEDNVKYSRATVNKTVDEDTTRVKLEGPVVDQIESASGTSNVTITMNVNTDDGDTKYSLKVATKNLQAGNKLYVYKENPETGERTMVNSLLYTVTEDGSVTFNTKQNANFVLVNKASAAALNKAIKKTLTAAKPSSSVKAGKKIKMALNPNLNMENVKSVKYSTTQSSVAKVSSNGTITAKKAGTVSIKATITLKNGYIKTVTTKITVKE